MARKNRIPLIKCKNCEAQLQKDDAYCPKCGQENHDHHLTIKAIVYEFVEGFTHYDNKVFSTIKTLFTSPGKLSKDFIEGKRIRYVPPVRLYIFAAFIFFLIMNFVFSKMVESIMHERDIIQNNQNGDYSLSIQINKAQFDSLSKLKETPKVEKTLKNFVLNKEINLDQKDEDGDKVYDISSTQFLDLISKSALDSIKFQTDSGKNVVLKSNLLNRTISIKSEKNIKNKESTNYTALFYIKPQFDTLDFKITKLEAKEIFNNESKLDSIIESRNLPWYKKIAQKKAFLNQCVLLFGTDKEKKNALENYSHNVTKYGSLAMYIMMPISAFFLFILFYRRQKYYFPHFLFSMHLHTFIFLCLCIAIGMASIVSKLKLDKDWIGRLILIVFLGIYFYYYKAQKYFYGTSRWKTVLEGGVVAIFYFIFFAFLITGIFSAAFLF